MVRLLNFIEKLYPMHSILFNLVENFAISRIDNSSNQMDFNIGNYTNFYTVGCEIKYNCSIGSVFKKNFMF